MRFIEEQLVVSADEQIKNISKKVFDGERISDEDAIYLFNHGELSTLGVLANHVREKKNGKYTFFNRNFHIEPTNLCVFSCKFCSYSQEYKHREAGWEMTIDQMLDKVKAYDGVPITEVHIVGGVHPKMDATFFGELLSQIKNHRPDLHIKAFTAVELDYMFRKAKMSTKEGMEYLISKGLNSIPGGGAEIFDEATRLEIAGDKCDSAKWLEIHQTAHECGIRSNCTMLYGHIETLEERVNHLIQLRELQDETGHFLTMTPLSFHPEKTELEHIAKPTADMDLRGIAVTRLMLDNFEHIKSFWIMNTAPVTQMALWYGADDADGFVHEYEITYNDGDFGNKSQVLTRSNMIKLIEEVDRIPIERDSLYNEIVREATVEKKRLTSIPVAVG
jgi:aminodeoxyfutalosine synthase